MDAVRPIDGSLVPAEIPRPPAVSNSEEAWEAARAFEGMMLGQLMKHMMSGVKTDGPFGGGFAEDMWRDLLVQQAGEDASLSGGVGIADQVYRVLMSETPVTPQGSAQSEEQD